MYTLEQKIKVARKAVQSVLRRIKEDEKVRYHLGAGSETYDRLTAAEAALGDLDLNKVKDTVIPGSSRIPHSTVEDYL